MGRPAHINIDLVAEPAAPDECRTSLDAALTAEVAERLLELAESGGWGRLHIWLKTVASISNRPSAMRLYLRTQAGMAAIRSQTLEQQAEAKGVMIGGQLYGRVTRQAVHLQMISDIQHIAAHAGPSLAAEIARQHGFDAIANAVE